MGFTFSGPNIRDNQIVFIYEECAFSGVRKIAGRVRDDIAKVFGAKPIGVEYADFHDTAAFYSYPVFFGTVGNSPLLDKLATESVVNLFDIAGESEIFSVNIVNDVNFEGFNFESAIVIAGSDKRGTIYGLFELSRMLGVSPLSDWLDIKPRKLEELILDEKDSFVSKKPSVKYRGLFINDEWPAFGTWCTKRFGGFNSEMYSHVFELILRLRGNLLWPAMWSAIFGNDGPGDANAALADELGIVMGTSHHEPCMRQGEEYKYLRGPGSKYGDDWNFKTNREGITEFWRDGIAARGKYENIYTVGMRGEADTSILGKDAALSDNIALLRDVIATQNSLLTEGIGKKTEDIHRMLVLYKEVEPFYYGDEKTPGLATDPVLDNVTVMFCDDNYGNLRCVPAADAPERGGGYGMYYHFDYHGLPVSYEWFNTTYLPKVWEQMTCAYDFGIRDIWVVNVGDIFTNEYPLSFFMDLAYDFDRWGTNDKNSAVNYTRAFVKSNFPAFDESLQSETEELLLGYTKITGRRRTEAMNDRVYAPFAYRENERALDEVEDLMRRASDLYNELEEDEALSFYELVYLPLTATMNIQKMWLLTSQNHAYAAIGSTVANTYAEEVKDCIKKDKKLVERLHKMHKGKWYGMGLSEHIGFNNWCEEECLYPVIHTVEPAQKPRLIVTIPGTDQHTEGGFWSGKVLTMPDALNPLVCGGCIELSTASKEKVAYSITSDDDFIDIIDPGKSVKCGQLRRIFVFVDRMKLSEDTEYTVGTVTVTSASGEVKIRVPVNNPKISGSLGEGTYIFCGEEASSYSDHIAIEAAHFVSKSDTKAGAFCVIGRYGRTASAIKAYPQNVSFTKDDAPSVTYRFMLKTGGDYNVRLYTSPANPCFADGKLIFTVSTGGGDIMEVNMIPEGFAVGDGNAPWEKGVLDNTRTKDIMLTFKSGINELTIGAISPGFVLERIVIRPKDLRVPDSYLGPAETYYV